MALCALVACAPRATQSVSQNQITLQTPGYSVAGMLTLPTGALRVPAVVLLSGYGPNDMDETVGQTKPIRDLADGLGRRGIASLRFNKPTLAATPAPGFTPTQEYVDAAAAAVRLLQANAAVDPARIFLLGHSFGGTMIPKALRRVPSVAGAILMGAPARPLPEVLYRQFPYLQSLGGTIGHNATLALPDAQAFVRAAADPSLQPEAPFASELAHGLHGAYFLDVRGYDPVATAMGLHAPMLVMQGTRDYLVTVDDDLRRWATALKTNPQVTVRVYPSANHAFVEGSGNSSPEDYEHPGTVATDVIVDIVDWIKAV